MIFGVGAIRPEFRYGKIGLLLLDVSILLGLLLAVSCLSLAFYIFITAYCSDFWVLLALSLLLFVITWFLYKRLRTPVYAKFVEASQIIQKEKAKQVTLRFPAVVGWSGSLIELQGDGASNVNPRIISLGLPKTVKTPKGDLKVPCWSDTKGKLSTVVVQISKQMLIGTFRNQADIQLEYRRMRRLFILLQWFGSLCAVLIAVYAAYEYNSLDQEVERALNSHQFPVTEAHIISSQVVETKVLHGKARVQAWYPQIKYAFSLEDTYQTGSRLSVAPRIYFDKFVAEEIVLKYSPGSIHDLYYDPEDFAFTVLEPGKEESLITEQKIFLTKWAAILIATIALTILFRLGRTKLVPGVLIVNTRVYGQLRRGKRNGR